MQLYSTREAAEYLVLTVAGLWYHLQREHLAPAKVGGSLVFTQQELDDFQRNRRPAGRPRKGD